MKSTGAQFYLMQLYELKIANVGITPIVCQETRDFFYTNKVHFFAGSAEQWFRPA